MVMCVYFRSSAVFPTASYHLVIKPPGSLVAHQMGDQPIPQSHPKPRFYDRICLGRW